MSRLLRVLAAPSVAGFAVALRSTAPALWQGRGISLFRTTRKMRHRLRPPLLVVQRKHPRIERAISSQVVAPTFRL
jgi:hypothetical protein